MATRKPVTMLVSYYPKPGRESELLALVKKHWPALHRVGLATDLPAQIWRATDKRSKQIHFVELFQWKSEKASDVAHETPEVRAIWSPMEEVLDHMQLARVESILPNKSGRK